MAKINKIIIFFNIILTLLFFWGIYKIHNMKMVKITQENKKILVCNVQNRQRKSYGLFYLILGTIIIFISIIFFIFFFKKKNQKIKNEKNNQKVFTKEEWEKRYFNLLFFYDQIQYELRQTKKNLFNLVMENETLETEIEKLKEEREKIENEKAEFEGQVKELVSKTINDQKQYYDNYYRKRYDEKINEIAQEIIRLANEVEDQKNQIENQRNQIIQRNVIIAHYQEQLELLQLEQRTSASDDQHDDNDIG